MTTVLDVAGSARREGNSDAVLEAALDALRERGADVSVLYPYRMSITPCRSCNACWETGRCVIRDEMQDLYPRFDAADHVVVAAPLYFTSLPGHLKVLVDRFQAHWVRTYRLKQGPRARRRGMFLCVGAMDRERYYRCTLTIVKTWLSCLNMACAVSRFYGGVDAPDALVRARPEYLADARTAAAELLGDVGA